MLLSDVPFYPQREYQCGPAALATVLNYTGVNADIDELVNKVYLPFREGSLQPELIAATRSEGRIPYIIDPNLPGLLSEIQRGHPVLVLQNLGLDWLPQWHYAVVVGFDLSDNSVTLRSGTIKNYTISLSLFEKTWRRAGNWGFVALEPGSLPASSDVDRYLDALVDMEVTATPSDLIPAYQAGVSRWPHSAILGLGLGNLLYQQGELHMAGEHYNRILQQYPDNATAHNNFAQVLLELGQIELAATHAAVAVTLGGSFATTYQRTLAKIREINAESP